MDGRRRSCSSYSVQIKPHKTPKKSKNEGPSRKNTTKEGKTVRRQVYTEGGVVGVHAPRGQGCQGCVNGAGRGRKKDDHKIVCDSISVTTHMVPFCCDHSNRIAKVVYTVPHRGLEKCCKQHKKRGLLPRYRKPQIALQRYRKRRFLSREALLR